MKHLRIVLTVAAVLAMVTACGGKSGDGKTDGSKKIILGFSQIGAESEWRAANTISVKSAAAEAGIELIFADAQQKQENQIKDIRSFIAQKVDVIAFSPVVETGWDEVLKEAKAAKIPVVLTDRAVKTDDTSLYVSLLGSDFEEEGKRAAKWLGDYVKKNPMKKGVNIVELRGTEGSAPAVMRKKGFEEVMKAEHADWKILKSATGDFTRTRGKEVMESFLKTLKNKITVLYAHNDDMALGAITAIEKAGLTPGKDIIIISVDATRGAFLAMKEGKINVTVECSPLLGPQLMSIVKDVAAGKTVEKRIITNESVFPAETAEKEFPNRKY